MTEATVSGALQVQYQDEAEVWHDFGPPTAFGSLARTRRFGAGPRQGVTAQKWRVVKVGDHDWGDDVASLDAVRFWRETATLSPVRLWHFSFDDETQRYVLSLTDRNIEIHHQGERVASIAAPHTGAQVRTVTRTQALDTLLQFHADTPPNRITRQGGHGEWDSRPATFKHVPIFDYLGTDLGGVNEVQQIKFEDYAAGDIFNLTLEGETTTAITWTATEADLAVLMQAALEALPSVGAGNVLVATTGANTFTVTFQGDLKATDLAELVGSTIDSNAGGVLCTTLTQGKEGGEAVFSALRGYPAAGAFYQSRLWMGGLKSRPQTLLASRLGDFFNLDTRGAKPDSGIDVTIDTDEVTVIRHIYPGRHLQFFTGSAEFYCPTEPIVPPPAVKQTTRRGCVSSAPPAELDGATVFVTRGGDALAEYMFDDAQQSYTAAHLSVLASHLVTGVVGLGMRRSRSTSETDLALMPRSDGKMAVMSALRAQDVTGFMRWTTEGDYLDAVADLAGEAHVAVRRDVGAGRENCLERLDAAAILDSSVMIAGPFAGPVTGLGHLEGQTVVIYIDGADAGDAFVEGGQVDLPYAALRSVEVGRNFQPRARSLPLVFENDPRGGAAMGARTGEIGFRLGPTANLKAGVAGARMWTVPLKRRPIAVLDEGPGENAFEGWTRLTSVPGFRADAQVEWVQERPGPLEIRELVVTVSS